MFILLFGGQAFAQYEFEKGDGIYRKASWPITDLGHAALYWGWHVGHDSSVINVQMNQHGIIEMQGDGIHYDHTVQDSINAEGIANFWGPRYYGFPPLSAAQRRLIITTARSFPTAEYGFFAGYKSPTDTPPTFRCDGLVEYCYEIALGDSWTPGSNGGIVINDTWDTMWPELQYLLLTPRTSGNKPQILVKDSLGTVIPEDDLTTDHHLIVDVSDGPEPDGGGGSGLTRLEIWKGGPPGTGTEVTTFRDNTEYDIYHSYNLWNVPGGDIYIRSFDQAGNEYIYHIIIPIPLDLIFIIDTTGSMYDDIAAAKSSAVDIVNTINSSGLIDYRVAVVDYRDFPTSPYGGAGDYPYHAVLPFSGDSATIVSAINSLSLGWGNDWPESLYSALIRSMLCESLGSWRTVQGIKKVVIVMTDAPPHDPEPFTGYTSTDVINTAWAVDPAVIYPISIGWDSTTQSYLEILAEGTEGEVFTALNASEVVDAIIEAIETTLDSPIANPGGLYIGTVGESITLDASASYDPDGTIVSYEWDWNNDGIYDETVTTPTITHGWSEEYSGTVRLRVTDNDGLTSVGTATVNISAHVVTGDLNGDGDVDLDDVNIIKAHLNQPASACPECDLDGDGKITALDSRKLVLLCTCPRCVCP